MNLLSYWKSLILPNFSFGFIGTLAAGVGIVSGLSNIFGGGGGGSSPTAPTPSTAPGSAAAVANPLAPYQQQWAMQLNNLMASPSAITTDPGYQFGMDQGAQALQRSLAGTGQTQSGQEQIALSQFGQQYAGQAYQQRLATLGNLATGNAVQGAQFGGQQQQQGYSNLMGGLGALSNIYSTPGAGQTASNYASNINPYSDMNQYYGTTGTDPYGYTTSSTGAYTG